MEMKTKKIWLGAVLVSAGAAVFFATGALVAEESSPTPMEQLGKELFFANISAPARSMSCAECHDPSAGWTGAIAGINLHGAVYRGAQPTRFGNRKPPSSAYASFSPVFHYDADEGEFVGGNFWDGRATGERLEELAEENGVSSPTAEQALGPFLNPVEQNMPSKEAVCERVARSKFAGLFEQVWGTGSLDCTASGVDLTYDRFGLSIAAYEASPEVNPFSSKFDAYWHACLAAGNSEEACGLAEGEKATLDPQKILTALEFNGLIEFGEYCAACHVSYQRGPGGVPPLFTDNRFDNIGVPKNPENPFYRMDKVYLYLDDGTITPINPKGKDWIDLGLGDFLRTRDKWKDMAEENDGKFRTPTLRNVDKRPGKGFPKAYMHNGVFKSLEEVVSFYNTRDVLPRCGPADSRRDWGKVCWPEPEVNRNLNEELFEGLPIGNFELDEEGEAAVVAFLKTLTDGYQPDRRGNK
jgi:cytochrome c peroxidase